MDGKPPQRQNLHKDILQREIVAESRLFDTVAIYLAMKRDFVEMEKLGIRVTDDGRTVIDGKAKKINCAMKWKDLIAFESFLVERLTSPAIPAPTSNIAGQPAVAAPADVNGR